MLCGRGTRVKDIPIAPEVIPLYLPGVPQNQADGIFDPKLVMTVQDTSDGMAATFNFVISAQ